MKTIFWTKLFLFLIALVLGVIFLFNFLIDPYGKREWVSQNIYKPVLNERAKKYEYIFYDGYIKKYDSLILGSSRVMQIIPSHISSGIFYNFGVHVANNREKLFILEEWLKRKPLKKVYFGIDFYNFHRNKSPLSLNTQKFQEGYSKDYLSFETLKLSFKTLKYTLKNTPQTYFAESGEIVYHDYDLKIAQNNFDFSDTKLKQDANSNYIQNYVNDKFEIDYGVFDLLEQVQKLSKQHRFEVVVFITPAHIFDIELVSSDKELSEKFTTIRQKLQNIFGKIYDFSQDRDCNSINENYYDVHHYRGQLGDKIIESIESNGDFGTILNHNNKGTN